ncbi:MAG TPA: extracellular solute-binding protein [Petrotogaceae bacterium]|nr:extracellular solute-binding protein [Petrotogaceae bacterium]HOT30965.1 extracellular solute-binding protein [Petrotogaceae bacterium]HPX17018.1 extracellular solute-binding protein [Petrotogaceae bacterium]HQC40494.1 extracellular solute-binding protein [Petrotogaceae bacterium]HQF33432.1 extracellular solute-binding protein [Petrotogaceae bacterium]
MKRVTLFLIFVCVLFTLSVSAKTTIVYWQYFYQTKVDTINQLIKEFEKLNPDIEVKQVTFPYENYNQKVAASIPAGIGPDVINLFYGWLPMYVNSGYLQELPKNEFNEKYFKDNFFPFVEESVKFNNKYYSVPTAVRTLALFWNKKLFKQAGLDPEKPPKTLTEAVEMAKILSKYDSKGNLLQAGFTMQPDGQHHHWIREVLVRQFGGTPYSTDNKKVLYDKTGAAGEVLKWYTDRITKDKIGYPGFLNDDVTAFKSQKAAMTIDGSFRIGTLNTVKDLEYGIAELPEHNGIKSNFASFWTHAITTNAQGERLTASIKFLKFITSKEAMELWLKNVGELPANPEIANKYSEDKLYGPFLKGLAYAHATFFADEVGQRNVILEAIDKVRLNNTDPSVAFKEAADKEQKILDDFWASK